MGEGLLLIMVFGALALGVVAFLFLGAPRSRSGSNSRGNMRAIVSAQRSVSDSLTGGGGAPRHKSTLFKAAEEARVERKTDSRLTIKKKLKYAQWKLPLALFHGLEIGLSLFVFSLAYMKFNFLVQLMSLSTGFLFMRWLLTSAVERRFRAFDTDYPSFILSLVGLLKTGMNTMNAVESAAQGMEDGSLVKNEVLLMMERLRLGISEDKSIGSFGEDVFHPEIELFVQALLLSRRVGGNLSDTLDRLAKQVRKRQYFRRSANAAVGMQRGSIWFILGILAALEVYLYFVYPTAVVGAWNDPIGKQVWQFGLCSIALGMFWVRQVTKIRV